MVAAVMVAAVMVAAVMAVTVFSISFRALAGYGFVDRKKTADLSGCLFLSKPNPMGLYS
ncbi:hypothetical protein SRABI96_03617 [Peribacillus sp. Bi96]|nr:hypothetical protein SRABI96_03617 [Peribacillus sp. Bi96]